MQTILKIPGFTDNIFTHILAGLGAGLFAVCIGSPIDVVGFLSPLLLSAKNNSLAAPNISISLYRLITKVCRLLLLKKQPAYVRNYEECAYLILISL